MKHARGFHTRDFPGSDRSYRSDRGLVAFAALLLLLALGCGDSTLGGGGPGAGPCDGASVAPECGAECIDDSECNAGFYCDDAGLCTADCTSNGGECGDLYVCTDRGRCLQDDGNDCPDVAVRLEPQQPTVILLIDQSGSMKGNFGNTSRWEAVRRALVDPVTGAVAQLQDRVVFGASLFSSIGGNAGGTCPMLQETPPALNNLANISSLIAANSPRKDTPTAESIRAVAASFPLPNPERPGPRAIILATDGNPDNCIDPDAHDAGSRANSEQAVAEAYSAGISTYVLSVGDEVLKAHLDRIADIGVGATPGSGTGRAYVANNPGELVSAFDEIIRGTRTCQFSIDGRVDLDEAASGRIELNGQPLDFGRDWRLIDETTLELIGDACTAFLEADQVLLTGDFPCGSVVL